MPGPATLGGPLLNGPAQGAITRADIQDLERLAIRFIDKFWNKIAKRLSKIKKTVHTP